MAVKIRLRRVGAKKQPAYRVVVADSHAPRDGRFIEIIGYYNPLTHPHTVEIDRERALYWLRHGAQPTDAVQAFLVAKYIWAEYKGEEVPVAVIAAPVEAAPVEEAVPIVEEVPVEEAPPIADVAPVEAPVDESAPATEPEAGSPEVTEETAPNAE